MDTLRIGQIHYLNILPLYSYLQHNLQDEDIAYITGHPTAMNKALHTGKVEVAPASVFEYLHHAKHYDLLPGLSIAAPTGPVQSVLFLSPVPLENMPGWLEKNGRKVCITTASATSVALLKILWKYYWKMPPVTFISIKPGTGPTQHLPFLEIGDHALKHYLNPPKDWVMTDLASSWHRFSGLPAVFAVWIVRRQLSSGQKHVLRKAHKVLIDGKDLSKKTFSLPKAYVFATHSQIQNYFQTLGYNLGPVEMASINLFALYCTKLNLLAGMPALTWAIKNDFILSPASGKGEFCP